MRAALFFVVLAIPPCGLTAQVSSVPLNLSQLTSKRLEVTLYGVDFVVHDRRLAKELVQALL